MNKKKLKIELDIKTRQLEHSKQINVDLAGRIETIGRRMAYLPDEILKRLREGEARSKEDVTPKPPIDRHGEIKYWTDAFAVYVYDNDMFESVQMLITDMVNHYNKTK